MRDKSVAEKGQRSFIEKKRLTNTPKRGKPESSAITFIEREPMAKKTTLADIEKASEAGDAAKTLQLVQQRKEALQRKRDEFAAQLQAVDDELSAMATFAYRASKALLGDLGVKISQGSGSNTSSTSKSTSSGGSKRGAKKVSLSDAEATEIQEQVASILAKKPKSTFECKELAEQMDFSSGEIRAACDTPEATEKGIAKVDSKGPWPVFQKG